MKTRKRIEVGLAALADADPRVAALWQHVGTPAPRARRPGFATLLRVIVAQQLSTSAAGAIWGRLEVAGATASPDALLGFDDTDLRALGLSRQKVRYTSGLARMIVDGELDLASLGRMDDEEAISALTAVLGLGRWSAECYLLFALGRPDVMPADDLALGVAAGRLMGREARLKPAELRTEAEAWRPWRSAAARLLWHAYGIDAL